MKSFLIIIFCLLSLQIYAQKVYLCTLENDLWEIDLKDCSLNFVVHVQHSMFDIAFHPDGRLFGVTGGRIFLIDTITGSTSLVHDIDNGKFTSLTIGSDGIMYLMGLSRDLWIYDIVMNTSVNLGNTGFVAAGDLTFYEGNLYVASSNAEIAKIDIGDPANSDAVIDARTNLRLLGIVSNVVGCEEVNTYVTYAKEGSGSEIHQIDFNNQMLQFICDLPINATGGASTTEFLASNPVTLDTLIAYHPDCNKDNGMIEVPNANGFGLLEYSLNGGPFHSDNLITGLTAGIYEVNVRDEKGCLDFDTISLLDGAGCPLFIPTVFSPNGDGINDLFRLQSNQRVDISILKIEIFDRWGNQVFQKHDISIDAQDAWWNGSHHNQDAQAGVFAYSIIWQQPGEELKFTNGTITLIR